MIPSFEEFLDLIFPAAPDYIPIVPSKLDSIEKKEKYI